jgi:SM-20-related protein
VNAAQLTELAERITRDGYAIVTGWLETGIATALRERALAHERAGELEPAAVGRGQNRAQRSAIRGDRIRWLDTNARDADEAELLGRLDALRVAINRETMLGLFDFEGHYALYPPGAGYARHRDRFHDDDRRLVSCVVYLNPGWTAADGGTFRLYLDEQQVREVAPEAGTLAIFLSDRFEHEVRPARRPRLAVTGWFRRRGLVLF